MKNVLIISLMLGASFGTFAQTGMSYHGKKISDKGAMPATQLATKMGEKDKMSAKVEGTVESVCKVKGCWMNVVTGNGQVMRVSFKDYGFFVPKDIVGKTVVLEGTAETTTTPVSELRHYAQDAGKSKEDIEKITEPEKALTFVADGVIVKK
ncbi:MAG: amino acid aminotransferase [Spirosoma sp.]|nr:amino acid aminotransferase [Spirosoma sp.]